MEKYSIQDKIRNNPRATVAATILACIIVAAAVVGALSLKYNDATSLTGYHNLAPTFYKSPATLRPEEVVLTHNKKREAQISSTQIVFGFAQSIKKAINKATGGNISGIDVTLTDKDILVIFTKDFTQSASAKNTTTRALAAIVEKMNKTYMFADIQAYNIDKSCPTSLDNALYIMNYFKSRGIPPQFLSTSMYTQPSQNTTLTTCHVEIILRPTQYTPESVTGTQSDDLFGGAGR